MSRRKKLIITLAIIIPALGFGYGIFYSRIGIKQTKAEEEFMKGYALLNRYQYSGSAEFFQKSLSYNPEFHLARRYLGQSLFFNGEPDEALSEWKVILDNGGYDPSLELHMQYLSSAQVEKSFNWKFRRTIRATRGYRFSFPVYLGILPNFYTYILSLNGENKDGNFIEIDANGNFNRNLRRVSGKLESPMGAAVGESELWITDYSRDTIHRLSLRSTSLPDIMSHSESLGTSGSGDLQFRGPAGICYRKGYFFVADSTNSRIEKISEQGKYITSFNYNSNEDALKEPFGIACDPQGNIYISEPVSSRILVLDEYGNLLKIIDDDRLKKPRHLSMSADNKELIIADEEAGIFIYQPESDSWTEIPGYSDGNEELHNFNRAYSAATDIFGNLYVAEYGEHQIVQMVPDNYFYTNLDLWIERVDVTKFPVIGIWVSVKDSSGKYLNVLNGDNFRIYENDADTGRLGSSYLNEFSNQVSSVLVMENSSFTKKNQESLEWLISNLVKNIRVKDKILMVTYSDTYREETEWTSSRLRLLQMLRSAAGTTKTSPEPGVSARTLYFAINKLLPAQGKRSVIWVTSGNIRESADMPLSRIEHIARTNHVILNIINFEDPDSLEKNENRDMLRSIAEYTGGSYLNGYSSKISALLDQTRQSPGNRYVLTYKTPANSDWHKQFMELRMKVNFRGQTGLESSGYYIP